MPFLLDTNHCIYLINGLGKAPASRTAAEANTIQAVRFVTEEIYLSEVTLGELYFGAVFSKRPTENQERIKVLKQALRALPVTEDVWQLFGSTKAALRQIGRSLADLDLLIACTAQVAGLILITNDADFANLPADFPQSNWAVPIS